MSVPRLFVPSPDIHDDRVELPDGEAHHATRVLRLGGGVTVRIFDGAGREWAGTLSMTPAPAVVALHEVEAIAEPPVRVTLALAVLKGDQMDHAVRDATMLGVTAIQPILTDHVTVPPRAWQSGAAIERWQRVAVASAKQCGRAVVPVVTPVRPVADVFRAPAGPAVYLFAEPSTGAQVLPVADAASSRPQEAVLIIGPEGGWSPAEIAEAQAAGAALISLGLRTLRAEAVPAIALAALWTVWGW